MCLEGHREKPISASDSAYLDIFKARIITVALQVTAPFTRMSTNMTMYLITK